MLTKVFISYRRDDSAGHAGRVHDRLEREFGRDVLFMDVDAIPLGVNFFKVLREEVAKCDVLLAVIGPNWLNARDEEGNRRLDSPNDFVRIEIATALQRDIPVIPLLLDGARVPKANQLPEDLKELTVRNGLDVHHASFQNDMDRLIRGLKRPSGQVGAQSVPPQTAAAPLSVTEVLNRVSIGVMAAGVLAMTYVGAYHLGVPVPWPGSPAAVTNPTPSQITSAEKNQAQESKAEEQAARRDPALSVTPGSGQSFRDRLVNGQPCPMCPEMIVAPAGSFTMGSPASEPERDNGEVQVGVTIARPLAVGKFAVTFAEWDACVADGGCKGYRPDDGGWGRGTRPVINVNWNDAKLYIDWLNAKTGKTYRLLSDAEREYVTRARTTTPFWWGPAITPKQANYDGSAEPYNGGTKGEYRRQTVPADSFEANAWGLYNVHGNVWERTEDCWNDSNQGNPGNGSARTTGVCGAPVVRGGSWDKVPRILRAAYRSGITSVNRLNVLGFRLARTFDP